MKLMKFLVVALVAGISTSCVKEGVDDAGLIGTAQQDVTRTWDAARVFLPSADGPVRLRPLSMAALQDFMEKQEKLLPVAIHMHGCAGFWQGTDRRGRYLASLGFVVIAPDSFARTNKPQSCDLATQQGGIYRGTLALRQEEAAHAIARVRALPWVDKEKMVLIGHSEGAITTATLSVEHTVGFKARVIEGWGCNAGWPEYAGLNSSPNQPVLSLVGNRDPWFSHYLLQGNCGEFMKNSASRSVVYDEPPLNRVHSLLDYEIPREDLRDFLCHYVHCAEGQRQ